MSTDCVFCKISWGEVPSFKIYEDDSFLAFLDIRPIVEGHTVVIPKKHFDIVWDVENTGEYFEVVRKIAKHYQKISGNEYVYSFIHGEGVRHAHVHILPSEDKGFGKKFSQALNSINNLGSLSTDEGNKIMNKYKFLLP